MQVQEYLRTANVEDVMDDPRRVFNFDETAIYLHPVSKKVICRKGAKNVYDVGSGGKKECLTVLLGCNANGDITPPMVYKYERIPSHLLRVMPRPITLGYSKSGWMNGDTFLSYMSHNFLPWAREQGIPFPIIVYLDGHASHLTLTLSEFCVANDIILVALPPNATHIMQPIDVGVIFPLKCIWKKRRAIWDRNNVDVDFSRIHFGGVLKDSIEELQRNLKLFANAFRTCGNKNSSVSRVICFQHLFMNK